MNVQTSHYHEQARAAYKRKDYTKALELFTRAIGRAPSVQLHDNRAACHEKLDDLPSALKDAKKTIQLAKEDPTGYVRAGRILVKMDRKSVALEIYTHGMKSVKHVGLGFEMLKKVHYELMTELSPPKSVDPLTVLPRELAEQVLGYLTFRQLMNTCLVSKQWAQFIRRTPNLWRHLDLSHAKRKVKNAFVSRAINIGRSKLTAATLNNLFDFDKALTALVRHCALEELTLRNTGLQVHDISMTLKALQNLRSLKICDGTIMQAMVLMNILHNSASTLETLECEDLSSCHTFYLLEIPATEFPSLKTLDLTWNSSWHGLNPLLNNLNTMPNLQNLKLHQLMPHAHNGPTLSPDLHDLKSLTHLDLILPIRSATDLHLPSTLVSLAIGTMQPDNTHFFDPHVPTSWSLPHLRELKLGLSGLPLESIKYALECNPNDKETTPTTLHTLSLTRGSLESHPSNPFTHARLTSLTSLSLSSCSAVNDTRMAEIAQALPGLRWLDISATDVTGAGIREVVEKGFLERLVANECRFVGFDAVDWARGRGVRVEFRRGEGMGSGAGRKVRF